MIDATPIYTDAVMALINRNDDMVKASDIAPIVRMSPDVIIKYAKEGKWDQDHQGNFVISGNRVKFFRLDFLQKGGYIPRDSPEKTTLQMILKELTAIRKLLEEKKGGETDESIPTDPDDYRAESVCA